MTKRRSKTKPSVTKAANPKASASKRSAAPATNGTALIVLGFDEHHKPRGARFDGANPDLVAKAADLMGLKVYRATNPDMAAVVQVFGRRRRELTTRSADRRPKSAKFEIVKGGLFPHCNTKEVHSFYRGMHLAQAGFYLFAAKQEIGQFEYLNPTKTDRALVDFGSCNVLFQVWTLDRLQDLLRVYSSLSKWPPQHRSDAAMFLTKLREFRPYFDQLRLANGVLEDYHRHRNDPNLVPYWRYYLPAWVG